MLWSFIGTYPQRGYVPPIRVVRQRLVLLRLTILLGRVLNTPLAKYLQNFGALRGFRHCYTTPPQIFICSDGRFALPIEVIEMSFASKTTAPALPPSSSLIATGKQQILNGMMSKRAPADSQPPNSPTLLKGNLLAHESNSYHTEANTVEPNTSVFVDRVIRLPEVTHVTGLSSSSVYLRLNESDDNKYYDPTFPRPFSLAANGKRGAVGWLLSQVLRWIYNQANVRPSVEGNCSKDTHNTRRRRKAEPLTAISEKSTPGTSTSAEVTGGSK
ncbi:helix-turn-helix transcriptional regulator [uncultured Propionivibrio sp.]|uniref:helix-turn-helix transcriptional regulator n=1 Tax=uncultured Propionivibrio sp. TaxID=426737 RepID=UPI003748CD21